MAEKGGKGSTLSGKGKAKGANLSSKKSKSKSKIISSDSDSDSDFDASPSPSPSPTPTPKGGKSKSNGPDFSKSGGKFDKSGTIAPSKPPPAPKTPETPVFNIEAELPANAKCMMDCEAHDILQKIQEHFITLSEDPSIKLPESFHKGVQYAKLGGGGGGYKNVEEVKRVLGMLKKSNVTDSEICLIANICPDSAEEVFKLLPKLMAKKRKGERGIEEVVLELVGLKTVKDGGVGGMDLD